MVEAIDADTVGLGGDSEIRMDRGGNLTVGPRRVIPLSLLAHQHPAALSRLRHQVDRWVEGGEPPRRGDAGVFLSRQRVEGRRSLAPTQQMVWEALEGGPIPLLELLDGAEHPSLWRGCVDQLMQVGLVVAAGFTPTDALHVLGRFDRWSVEAARLGAVLFGASLDVSPEQLCEMVLRQVEVELGHLIIASALSEETGSRATAREGVAGLLIDRALRADAGGSFTVAFDMHRSLVAIGAPVSSYLPAVAKRLNARLLIPDHAEVRGALGAVVGGIVQRVRVLIQPLVARSAYRVHLPGEMREFGRLEDAVACAEEEARKKAENLALRAGAGEPKLRIERKDQVLRDERGSAEEVYLGTEVTATAVGRPRASK
jgi:N-methylhydantoinase A/oxoprolinase/acetone carboxylase beta subunit